MDIHPHRPLTSEVRYVGVTYDPRRRFNHHVSGARSGKRKLRSSSWILSLLRLDHTPLMLLVDATNDAGRGSSEIAWIAYYTARGCKLTNLTEGGGGGLGHRHTEEAKRRIGDAFRGKPLSEETKRETD